MRKFYWACWLIWGFCSFTQLIAQERFKIIGTKPVKPPPYNIRGEVFNPRSGEKLIGANITIDELDTLVISDFEGKYSVPLFPGLYTFRVTVVGYETTIKKVKVVGPWRLNFRLKEEVTSLDEVVIESESADRNVSSKTVGKNVLDLESIKSLPPLAGEVDILKSLTLLPGVITQGEASSGFSVRGGGTDQNLLLLGGATLYNPSHLFGFFSSFNSSVVRNVSLYKGVVPASYGGRASSVIDVNYRKGNFGHWAGDVSAGIVASRFSAGGPLVKDKLSIMMAGRFAYPKWLLKQSNDPNISNSDANFWDVNFIASYLLNDKNDLEYSFYQSRDRFDFASQVTNEWSNRAHVIRWNSTLSEKLSLHVDLIQSRYRAARIDNEQANPIEIESKILHHQGNIALDWAPKENSLFKVGAQVTHIRNELGEQNPIGDSEALAIRLDPERGIEMGFYAQHEWDITQKLGITYGIRYSRFSDRGPGTVTTYDPNQPRSPNSITGSSEISSGSIQEYDGWEPRVQFRYTLSPSSSIKGGFSQSFQYIHLITNTNSILPTDIWKLSDPYIKPQQVRQFSLGLFKNLKGNRYEVSLEGYYKDLDNLVEYKEGADLFINPNLETELIPATGTSYGVELYIKKEKGRLNGWFSYTYSRIWRTVDNTFSVETLNEGRRFPGNLDSPHNFNFTGNYRLGANTTLSFIFTYSSGRPVTLPEGKFFYEGLDLALYNDRNNARAAANHRLDVSLKFKIPNKSKILNGDWTLGVYNLYGRENPFSVFFQDIEGAPPQAYQLSIVGSPFPTISYEVTF